MPDNNYLTTTDSQTELPINGHPVFDTASHSPYELRSEEVQDITTKMPSWIVRQGTTVLFSVIVLLFIGAYLIRFPDVVTAPVHIKPVNIEARFEPGKEKYLTIANVPSERAGKIKTGQQVFIKLPLYPYQQFGMIEGKVESISPGSTDTAYDVNIGLINGLVTSSNKSIVSSTPLSGTAEVLCSDETILQRLSNTIRADGQ